LTLLSSLLSAYLCLHCWGKVLLMDLHIRRTGHWSPCIKRYNIKTASSVMIWQARCSVSAFSVWSRNLRASKDMLSHWFWLHLQSLVHSPSQGGLTSNRRPVVKIVAKSLSQHDEKMKPTPPSNHSSSMIRCWASQ
jgi:hypothetical protein